MAWNESFSHEGGGGWTLGETSFATAGPVKDSATSRAGERLAPPVTVSELCSHANPEEKHVLGSYNFSTVYTIGIVRSYHSTDNMLTHVIYDPQDDTKEYNILTYNGANTESPSEKINPFVEGSYIEATGRLRNLNGEYAIMTFSIREVVNEKEYQAFTLEARIAKLFFANDIYHLLQSGRGENLLGYPLGPPAAGPTSVGNSGGGGGGMRNDNMNTFSQQSRIYDNNPPAQSHGIGGQRGKILEVLEANKECYGENGMSIDDIKLKVGAMNLNQLRSDLDFLVNEGHAYHTINDDNFALIG